MVRGLNSRLLVRRRIILFVIIKPTNVILCNGLRFGFDDALKEESRFLTNNLEFSPLTIARIYKQRWDIETLFRRIKQNFQFHNFLEITRMPSKFRCGVL